MKAFLRKQKVRVTSELSEAVKRALETVSHSGCVGGVHACGYVR